MHRTDVDVSMSADSTVAGGGRLVAEAPLTQTLGMIGRRRVITIIERDIEIEFFTTKSAVRP